MQQYISKFSALIAMWFSTTRIQVRKYQQALAECRRLKKLLAEEEDRYRSDVLVWNRNEDEMAAEARRLMHLITEQDQELKAMHLQIEHLQAERDVAKTQIDGMAKVHSGQSTLVDMLIAQHVAAVNKATTGSHQQNGIGDLL
jgi:hypothetical protein